MELVERAFAKLNLTLDVLGRRSDGYHEMLTVMLSVGLFDTVHIRLTDSGEIEAATNLPHLPTGRDNLAGRAAEELLRILGERRGVSIYIEKRIPDRAGLAGGSSDAAAVIRGLYGLLRPHGDGEEMYAAARRVGSDVAFCIAGGAALATGRGDVLRKLEPLPRCGILIVKPEFSVSTPELFARIDGGVTAERPDTEGMTAALRNGDLVGVAARLCNVFEPVLPAGHRERVEGIKSSLLSAGALGAAMTGTGSAVYGIFEDEAAAGRAASPELGECFITSPVEKNPAI